MTIAKSKVAKVTALQKAQQDMYNYAALAARKVEIEQDKKTRIAAIHEEHAQELEALEPQLTKLEAELNIFAENNTHEFKGKKTLKLEAGTIGWRLDMGKLIFKPETDLDAFKKLIKKQLPDAIEEKVDSKKVISGCKLIGKLPVELEKLGITVEQKDNFFVTPAKA